MQEHAKTYTVNPEDIAVEDVPIIHRISLKSGEPLDSEHNRKKVESLVGKSEILSEAQKKYIMAIYLEVGKVTPNVSGAREMLDQESHEQSSNNLFKDEADRLLDIAILKKLLCPPRNWVAHAIKDPQPQI